MQFLSESKTTRLWGRIVACFQPKDADLTSIAALTGTSGLLKKTAANTWALDTNTYALSSSLTSHTGNTSNPHSVTKSQVGLGNVTNDAQVKRSEMGVASGVATLGTDGKVPSSQLPSYVDDVIEGYLYSSKFYKESAHTNQITGETGKIYVDLTSSKTYRWSGSAFSVISETLALGETSSTAYAGNKGAANATNIATLQGYFTSGVAKNAARLSNTAAIGSTSKPVYFTANGVPAAISYSIGRNVAAGEDVTAYTAGDSISISSHVVKVSMTAVSSPSSSGSALSFIDTISQSTAGRITVTKKAMREASASQSGIVSTAAQTFAGNKTIQGTLSVTQDIMSTGGGVSAMGICDLSLGEGGTSPMSMMYAWSDSVSDSMALSSELGLELHNTKANAASITAGTAGTADGTSGATLSVPYVTVNSQGIVTAYGVHSHTINGLLTALTSNTTNAVSITVAGSTLTITAATMKTSLGLGSAAYCASSAFLGASAQAVDSAKLGGTAKSGLLTALSSDTTNAVSVTVGGTTKSITVATMKTSLGLGSAAYCASTAFLGASAQAVDSAKLGGTALSGLLTALSSSTTNAVSITVGGTTKNITVATMKTSLGLGSFAYISSLAFSSLTSKPTTVAGYGITDCSLDTTLTDSVITAFELTIGSKTVTVGEVSDEFIDSLTV